MDMSNLPKDVDQVAVVVDWLDACRRHELGPLLDLYASDARLECECDGGNTYAGRAALEAYWRPRLEAFSPDAFGLQEIAPSADGVVLDYLNFEGKPVRIVFTFDLTGKILQNRCGLSFRDAPPVHSSKRPSRVAIPRDFKSGTSGNAIRYFSVRKGGEDHARIIDVGCARRDRDRWRQLLVPSFTLRTSGGKPDRTFRPASLFYFH